MDEPEIGDVHEGVVEGGEDTGDAEDELACSVAVLVLTLQTPRFSPPPLSLQSRDRNDFTFSNLGSKRDVLGGSALNLLLGWHDCWLEIANC